MKQAQAKQTAGGQPTSTHRETTTEHEAREQVTVESTAPEQAETRRSSRHHTTVPEYNDKKLSGTACHTPVKYLKKQAESRNVSGATLVNDAESPRQKLSKELDDKLQPGWTLQTQEDGPEQPAAKAGSQRKPSRLGKIAQYASSAVANFTSSLGKRRRDAEDGIAHTIERFNSQSKRRSVRALPEVNYDEDVEPPPYKRSRLSEVSTIDESSAELEDKVVTKPRQVKAAKTFLKQGLYVGQDPDFDARMTTTKNQKKLGRSSIGKKPATVEFTFPLPMFGGKQRLETGEHFQLPFSVFSANEREAKQASDWCPTRGGKSKYIPTRSPHAKLFSIWCSFADKTQTTMLVMHPSTWRTRGVTTTRGVLANPRKDVTRNASTSTACGNATRATAMLENPAGIASLRTWQSASRKLKRASWQVTRRSSNESSLQKLSLRKTTKGATLVGCLTWDSRLFARSTEGLVFRLYVPSSLAKSSWSTLVRSLPKPSVTIA